MQETSTDPTGSPAPAGEPGLPEARDVGADLYRHMVRARVVSAHMVTLQRRERIGFHTASIGHEAAIVGAALAALPTDWIFPGARDWYAALARGMPLGAYVHHAFGSAADPAKGHAAPDHAPGRSWNVVAPSGLPGAHLPQAAGAAWAAKIRREDVAAVALFGAEVAAAGDFHNALNFAGVMKAPVVFVCRTPADGHVTERAVAYGVGSAKVSGADVRAVVAIVREALVRGREGNGPTLIEVTTPTLALDALDEAALVSERVLDLGEADPIASLRRALGIDAGVAAKIMAETARELELAVAAAERAGPPARETIFDDVYASVPPHLVAQRQTSKNDPSAKDG